MERYKFYNETFEVYLELVLTKGDSKKSTSESIKHLQKRGFDLSDSKSHVKGAAFCTEILKGGIILVHINTDAFTNNKGGRIETIIYLQHECNHFRQYVLESIHERVERTDLEAHLRLSDWAFKKCLTTPHFKKLFK